MKRMLSLALALCLLLTACAGRGVTALTCAQAPPEVEAAADPVLDAALADFGLELLRQTRRTGENTFLSPLSVLLCLSMAANGAAGETLSQFEKVLSGNSGLDALNANCASLLAEYAALPEETRLSIADSLWLDERVRAEDAFIGRCTSTYQAGVFAADFTQNATCGEINAWIEEQTGGHVKQALDSIHPSTVLALVNAVYFEGKWEAEFDPGDTEKGRPFYREDGVQEQVDLMYNGGREELLIDWEGQRGVLLPYRDGRLAFLAVLPGEDMTLSDYLNTMDGESFQKLLSQAHREYLSLYLPKFHAQWKQTLIQPLQAMGLIDAFDPALADLSGMGTDQDGNGLYISAVTHGAGVEVDEQGTRAFAFTFAGMSGGGCAPAEELIFDRPFLYGIVDLERGIPLFIGSFEHV